MAISCAIPGFWELSTVLPLAASQGWGGRQLQWLPLHLCSSLSYVDFLEQEGTGRSSLVSTICS